MVYKTSNSKAKGSRDVAVVRTLSSHQSGLGCHMSVEFVVTFRLAPRIFPPKNKLSKVQFDRNGGPA